MGEEFVCLVDNSGDDCRSQVVAEVCAHLLVVMILLELSSKLSELRDDLAEDAIHHRHGQVILFDKPEEVCVCDDDVA